MPKCQVVNLIDMKKNMSKSVVKNGLFKTL